MFLAGGTEDTTSIEILDESGNVLHSNLLADFRISAAGVLLSNGNVCSSAPERYPNRLERFTARPERSFLLDTFSTPEQEALVLPHSRMATCGKSWAAVNDFYLLPGGCGKFGQNLNGQISPKHAGYVKKRPAAADQALVMRAVADYIAFSAQHGILQRNRMKMRARSGALSTIESLITEPQQKLERF